MTQACAQGVPFGVFVATMLVMAVGVFGLAWPLFGKRG